MEEVILWCNSNTGFISFLLAALTLLTSIIAIAISIHTARLPYKKKVLINSGSYLGVGANTSNDGFHITAINIGNRQVKISEIGLKVNEKILINIDTMQESRLILTQGEETEQYFQIGGIIHTLQSMQVSGSTKVFAYVKDTEGKEYKKYFAKVSEIMK